MTPDEKQVVQQRAIKWIDRNDLPVPWLFKYKGEYLLLEYSPNCADSIYCEWFGTPTELGEIK